MSKKHHPSKNLGNFLHPAKKQNPLAQRMKAPTAPVRQTKLATPKAPVIMKPEKMNRGRRG